MAITNKITIERELDSEQKMSIRNHKATIDVIDDFRGYTNILIDKSWIFEMNEENLIKELQKKIGFFNYRVIEYE